MSDADGVLDWDPVCTISTSHCPPTPAGRINHPCRKKVATLVDGILWMDASEAIRSLCVSAGAEGGGRGCLHRCAFNEGGRVHFHVFAFQMCCNRVIKLLDGASHLCLAVVLRRCLAFTYERGWDSALWLQLKSLSVQSSHGRANAPDRGRWGNFLKMAGGGGGGGGCLAARERRTCRIEEWMGSRVNERPPPTPQPMLLHVNPRAAEALQTEVQVRTPAAGHENADTSITPQGVAGGENMLNLMRKSVPCEEETFIHVFCLFSKTNRGRYYAATLITLLSFTVKFQIRGFSLLTFMVISKPACCLPSPPPRQQNAITWTFTQASNRRKRNNFLEPRAQHLAGGPDLRCFYGPLDGAIQLARKPETQTVLAFMRCVRLSCVNEMQLILYSFWLTDFDQFFDF